MFLSVIAIAFLGCTLAIIYHIKTSKETSRCEDKKFKCLLDSTDLTGKTALVTGGNNGIGFATAKYLAMLGAKVIIACRNLDKGNAAKEKIYQETNSNKVIVRKLDLAWLKSVQEFVEEIKQSESRLDILINNAGVSMENRKETQNGLELCFGVNHIGHFLLTTSLLDLIKSTGEGRIINVSSSFQYGFASGCDSVDWSFPSNIRHGKKYAQSKLMNCFFTRELHRRFQNTGITAYTVNPGLTQTDLFSNFGLNGIVFRIVGWMCRNYPFANSLEKGASTIVYCSVSKDVLKDSGEFFSNCAVAEHIENPLARDEKLTKKLWEVSEEIVKKYQ